MASRALTGASWKLVAPLGWDNLLGVSEAAGEEFAVFDELGAGVGHRIAISEGREAAMPFYPGSQADRRLQRGDPRPPVIESPEALK